MSYHMFDNGHLTPLVGHLPASCTTAQATIQGALGSLPLMLITSSMSGKPDFQQYEEYGNDILHATTFSIILAAPVGLLIIALLGPQWLSDVRPLAIITRPGHVGDVLAAGETYMSPWCLLPLSPCSIPSATPSRAPECMGVCVLVPMCMVKLGGGKAP